MFKKVKASSTTRGASAESASEKKIKKRSVNINIKKICKGLGYAAAVAFIVVAAKQSASAISSTRAASIVYDNQMAKLLEEKEKARQAVIEKLKEEEKRKNSENVNTDTKDIFSDDHKDSDTINEDVDYIDHDGNQTTFYIYNTCSKCGNVIHDGSYVCSKCGYEFCKYRVYQVKRGDTLSSVSGEVGASVDSIAHLNEIDNVNLIYEGESLRIPQ